MHSNWKWVVKLETVIIAFSCPDWHRYLSSRHLPGKSFGQSRVATGWEARVRVKPMVIFLDFKKAFFYLVDRKELLVKLELWGVLWQSSLLSWHKRFFWNKLQGIPKNPLCCLSEVIKLVLHWKNGIRQVSLRMSIIVTTWHNPWDSK